MAIHLPSNQSVGEWGNQGGKHLEMGMEWKRKEIVLEPRMEHTI